MIFSSKEMEDYIVGGKIWIIFARIVLQHPWIIMNSKNHHFLLVEKTRGNKCVSSECWLLEENYHSTWYTKLYIYIWYYSNRAHAHQHTPTYMGEQSMSLSNVLQKTSVLMVSPHKKTLGQLPVNVLFLSKNQPKLHPHDFHPRNLFLPSSWFFVIQLAVFER